MAKAKQLLQEDLFGRHHPLSEEKENSEKRSHAETKKDLAKSYNEFKEFEGKKYTGMKVGRSHRWKYESGEWKEKKVAPDRWEFTYEVAKKRAARAPPGSGVPLGTEYHWYILAHQIVRKLDENTYSTAMSGLKYKLSHKRADKGKWAQADRAQKRRLIQILQEMIAQLQKDLYGNAKNTTGH